MKGKVISSMAGLVIGIVVVAFFLDTKSKKIYKNELENIYHSKELELQTKLEKSDSERKALRLSFDSLSIRHRGLVRMDSLREIEFSRIPHRFDTLTSSELADRMIEEYNKAHK